MRLHDLYPLDTRQIRQLIADTGWCTIVSADERGLAATYAFCLLEADTDEDLGLLGHFSADDPQAAALRDGNELLVIFEGPHGYISAAWYAPDLTDVPSTWNHVSVHLHCTPEVLPEAETFAVLSATVETNEAIEPIPWQLTGSALTYSRQLAPGTIGFRLRVHRIEAKAKLSQEMPIPVQRRIAERLIEPGPHSKPQLGRWMQAGLPPE